MEQLGQISVGNCPHCGVYPVQFIGDSDVRYIGSGMDEDTKAAAARWWFAREHFRMIPKASWQNHWEASWSGVLVGPTIEAAIDSAIAKSISTDG